jgi:hypothetical protein
VKEYSCTIEILENFAAIHHYKLFGCCVFRGLNYWRPKTNNPFVFPGPRLVYNIRAANYCRTSDNVRLNLANVRAKVILIGHWSDHTKKICHIIHFLLWQNPIANSLNLYFAIKFTRHSSILLNVAPEWLYILVLWLIYILWRIYVQPNLVMLVFVRLNSSYVRSKLKVIGQMSCQVKYLFAALNI